MTSRTRNRILAAIAAAVPALALTLPAPAQQRVNQDGRARDANPRVGSDGSNDRNNNVDARGSTYTGNQVVTGNVSGARSFRGGVPYSDPLELSTPTASRRLDRFVRDSAGAPTRTNPTAGYGQPTAFYGDSRAAPVPPGYRSEGFTGGLYNTGASQQTVTGRSPYQNANTWGSLDNGTMLRPSEFTLSGGVNQQTNQPQFLSASPLYGVVPLGNQPGVMDSRGDRLNPSNPADRLRLNPADRDRMRDEINEAGQAGDEAGEGQPPQPGALQPQVLSGEIGSGGGRTESARAAAAAGRNQANTDVQRGDQLQNQINADPLQGGVQTQQGVQSPLQVPPSRQSKQYAELQARFQARQASGPLSPEESNMQQRMLRLQQQTDAGGNKAPRGVGRPGAAPQPGAGEARPPLPVNRRAPQRPAEQPAPGQPEAQPQDQAAPATPPPANAGVERPAPLRVKSLAEGVDAKGLRDLLVSAEELMKAGNFRSAIDKYAAAEQVAPNNPLIRLGRGQAELGGARYVAAEQSLRQAFQADPALLMGRYDLESFIGRDRLAFVVKELQQISRTEAGSPRPMLLLAYIAYGTGQDSAAADYLNQAAERSRRPDPLIDAMRKTWTLPAAGESPAERPAEAPAAQPEAAPEQAPAQPAPDPGADAPDLNK